MSNLDATFHRPSGKTPPPAPSAAYAKRAREIQAEEGLGGRYRPPALRNAQSGLAENASASPYDTNPSSRSSGTSDNASLAPNSFPAGFRRARAGTLPSNVQLAAQHYASSLDSPISASDFSADNTPAASPMSTLPVARPALRHAASAVTSSVLASERNSRLRSGSLTLPQGGISSNAFGPSIFSSSWLSGSSNRNNMPGNSYSSFDEMRQPGEFQSGDDYDVHTLDYLGLDDSPVNRTAAYPPPATISELRNQTQAALVGGLANSPSRLRANTVANPYRRSPALQQRLAPSLEPSDEEDNVNYQEYDDYPSNTNGSQYMRQRIDSFDGLSANNLYGGNDNQYGQKSYKNQGLLSTGGLSNRLRASTVSHLEDPNRVTQQRRVVLEEPQSAHSYGYQSQQQQQQNQYDHSSSNSSLHSLVSTPTPPAQPTSILRSLQIETNVPSSIHLAQHAVHARNINSPSVRFPASAGGDGPRSSQLNIPGMHHRSGGDDGRAVSPRDGPGTQLQTPSRSLWIGNLDPSVSGEDLARAFAPYGAIESFRLLPEKECGFVNFVEISDAMRAKDDVLNRLGGIIGMVNNQAVRIGFGKADSAPATPSGPNSGGTHSSHFLSTPTTAGPAGLASPGGLETQLQSSPTRALWIGSIPSATTPATILSVFSPFGPIESARVLTHKNCGFVNFERLDDAVRARKALNGRDVLGSDVGAIRIGFARVPVKNAGSGMDGEDSTASGIHGVGDLSVGATIHALRGVKGATAVPTDQQVLGGAVENYRSNLLLSMLSSTTNPSAAGSVPTITEQQLIIKLLSDGSPDSDADVQALSDFRPPTTYYTTIPVSADRAHNRRWDASKLRELRKRLDSGSCTVDEIDDVAADFLDGEIVDLASDWLGNTVVQKLFERCSPGPRYAMLERIAPHLAMIGIHKNGTWAAQKVIECAQSVEETGLIALNLRPYTPPLLLDQFGNYVVQCCLRFGSPANDFIFDAMADRLWEIAQGRFGARSMRACLESPHVTPSQQRRIATAVILNSIPLATNPNGALLLTWLLDTSGFHARYRLLAPRFTPHLSHLCTHKLASLTVLRIVNQKSEPDASTQIVHALFFSPGDHVLTDVLGDQINGVAVVHKILQSPYLDPSERPSFLEATKRVLVDLKVTSAQAYRRLIEEVGLPTPNFAPSFSPNQMNTGPKKSLPPPGPHSAFGNQGPMHSQPGVPNGYPQDPSLASMMASMQALQIQAQVAAAGGPSLSHNGMQGSMQSGPPQLQINPQYAPQQNLPPASSAFSPSSDPFNPFSLRSPEMGHMAQMNQNHNMRSQQQQQQRRGPGATSPNGGNANMNLHAHSNSSMQHQGMYGPGNPALGITGLSQVSNGMMGMDHQLGGGGNNAQYGGSPPQQQMHPQLYQAYMYQLFQQQQQNGSQNGGGAY